MGGCRKAHQRVGKLNIKIMDTLKKESKSMFSSETLDSMAMAEVYGGAAEAITLEMEMEMDAARKTHNCGAKCSCPKFIHCSGYCACIETERDTFVIGDVAVMAMPVAMTAISPVAVDFTR